MADLELLDLRGVQLSIDAAAEVLEVSITTAKRDWERTRAYLYKEMRWRPGL